MLNIFICEDETAQREKIKTCVQNYILIEDLDARVSLAAASPGELLEHIAQSKDTGLYFLDIDLHSDIDGIELAEAIRRYDPRGFIIFVTTHGEALPLTFKHRVEAMDYIVKDDMENMEARITACVKDAYTEHTTPSAGPQPKFVFKMTESRTVSVPLDGIIYIETAPHVPRKVILHTESGFFEFYGKLEEIITQLDGRFFRCHKSFIVNTQMVETVDRKDGVVGLKGGGRCLASTRKVAELLGMI